jgi:glycosyltransferase involved in cell wall biosynthesis
VGINLPRISVVIPSYNQARFIGRTLRSVVAQGYPDLEVIVVDGGSTDDSWEVIRSFAEHTTYAVSEKDRGQSHAINKGFSRASGPIVTWLNSDDVLLPGALHAVARVLTTAPAAQWITGSCVWIDSNDRILRATVNPGWNRFGARGRAISVGGPSSFMTKSVLESVGMLDEDLHYSMDTELWTRLAKHGIRYESTGTYLWGLRLHPAAKMSGHNFAESTLADPNHPSHARRASEQISIRTRHGLPVRDAWPAYLGDKLHRVSSGSVVLSAIDTFRTRGMPLSQASSLLNRRSARP